MKTVAIDARMLGASGIGTYVDALIKQFVGIESDFQFSIIGQTEKINSISKGNSKFKIIHSDIPIFSFSEQLKIPGLARNADLLHSPHHDVPVFRKGKLLVTLMDMLHWDHPEYIPNWKAKIYLKSVSRRIAKASGVIVPSKFTAGRLLEHIQIPEDKIYITPLGVNFLHFSPRS